MRDHSGLRRLQGQGQSRLDGKEKSGIYIVYTKEAQTADSYIERATYDLGKNHRVRVATSDNMEQVIILGHGALRISARAFEEEVAEAEGQISDLIERWNVRDFDLRRVRATATIIDKRRRERVLRPFLFFS